MRSLADTLPTLQGSVASAAHALPQEDISFAPDAILKALGEKAKATLTAQPSEEGRTPLSTAQKPPRPFLTAELPRANETPPSEPKLAGSIEALIPSFERSPRTEADDALVNAVQRAKDIAEEEKERAVAAARAEEQAHAKSVLEAEEARWADDLANVLNERLDHAFADLHNSLSDTISLALSPVLEDAMRERAVLKFSATLERLMGRQGSAKPITVSGPQQLLDALRKTRGGDTSGLRLVASDEADLTAELNETTLRTTIKAWATTLSAAIGPSHVQKR